MVGAETRAQARRRVYRRRRQVAATVLILSCTLLVLGGFRLAAALTDGPGSAATDQPKSSSTPGPSPGAGTSAPVRGTGVYSLAPGGTVRQGSGTVVTYRVEVENGAGQSAPAFAAAVDATLADPASWAGHGRWSVQRVSGKKADLVIRLATAATVGAVCGAAGLEDASYSSCRTGQIVMINLQRWLTAVPEYHGDVALYRHYLINHEVGHGLGYGHQACPGPGLPAPVMQQQTLGLKGCLPNGWPYIGGKLVSGKAGA
ncbi:MAG: DUF3152 domain-containing protein [Dermatophilaceae bacterium]